MDLEEPAFERGLLVGGISYDFRKCFDLVPIETMLEVMELRGASPRVLKPLKTMYAQLERAFDWMELCQSGGGLITASYKVMLCRWWV